LHQVGDLFELNIKLRCQNFKQFSIQIARNSVPIVKGVLVTPVTVLTLRHAARFGVKAAQNRY